MLAPGSAMTWFVMKMEMLNYSEIFWILFKHFPRTCCLSESSPLPEKSTLNGAMIESMTMRANWSSIIAAPAYMTRLLRVSTVKALPTMMLLSTCSASKPNLLAICLILSGRLHNKLPFASYLQCVLSVYIEDFALSASLAPWQLSSDAKGVSKLRLACSELSKRLCDALALNTALFAYEHFWVDLQRRMSNSLEPVVSFLIFFRFSKICMPVT